MKTKKRVLKYTPKLALQNSTCFHAAHLATDTWLDICCPHLAHESCYRRMCLCCHLLVKPWLSPQDLPTSKRPRLFYFPSPVLVFGQEIIGHKKQTEWVIRIGRLVKASVTGVPGEDWNCKRPHLACFTAMCAYISVCGPWFFFQRA